MKILITVVLTTAAMLSLNANNATVTTQVQKMSYESTYYDSCDVGPELCESYTIDYSNDDLFFTFTATWDDVSSILGISVSDGNSFQFADGYYTDGYEDSGPLPHSSESESVTIDVLDGEITSFQAYNNYSDYIGETSSSTSWVYDGIELVITYSIGDFVEMSYYSNTLTYDVISSSPVLLPAGIYLFLSGLLSLGVARLGTIK